MARGRNDLTPMHQTSKSCNRESFSVTAVCEGLIEGGKGGVPITHHVEFLN